MVRTVQQKVDALVDGRRQRDKRRRNNQPYKRRKRGTPRGSGG